MSDWLDPAKAPKDLSPDTVTDRTPEDDAPPVTRSTKDTPPEKRPSKWRSW